MSEDLNETQVPPRVEHGGRTGNIPSPISGEKMRARGAAKTTIVR